MDTIDDKRTLGPFGLKMCAALLTALTVGLGFFLLNVVPRQVGPDLGGSGFVHGNGVPRSGGQSVVVGWPHAYRTYEVAQYTRVSYSGVPGHSNTTGYGPASATVNERRNQAALWMNIATALGGTVGMSVLAAMVVARRPKASEV